MAGGRCDPEDLRVVWETGVALHGCLLGTWLASAGMAVAIHQDAWPDFRKACAAASFNTMKHVLNISNPYETGKFARNNL